MAIHRPTPGFKGRTLKFRVLTRWDFNFCVRSNPLRGRVAYYLEWEKVLRSLRHNLRAQSGGHQTTDVLEERGIKLRTSHH